MNNQPRKTLDFKTSNEVMAEELNQITESVALDS